MTSSSNPISAIVAESSETLQALLSTFHEDSELQQEIRQILEKLTAKIKPEMVAEAAPSAEATEDCCDSDDTENESEGADDSFCCIASDLSDGDVVATLALGFIAGAAVVGGGILLHKLLAD